MSSFNKRRIQEKKKKNVPKGKNFLRAFNFDKSSLRIVRIVVQPKKNDGVKRGVVCGYSFNDVGSKHSGRQGGALLQTRALVEWLAPKGQGAAHTPHDCLRGKRSSSVETFKGTNLGCNLDAK